MGANGILAINPGSTSTRAAFFNDTHQVVAETLRHSAEELRQFPLITDQMEFRRSIIELFLARHAIDHQQLAAVVGRGGLLKPLSSGTYRVNDVMIKDLSEAKQGQHASNLGGILAHAIASPLGIPAFIVDPVSVDELEPVARISGLPELPRKSMLHALNIRAVAHRVAADMNTSLPRLNLVVAHLGGGISIAPMRCGRLIDVNNANESGPFSPERAGTLPVVALIKLCYSEQFSEKELIKRVNGQGGLVAHLGTTDLRDVTTRAASGDQTAELVFSAMAYQIAKEIGAMACALRGKVDRVVLTGGMAHSAELTHAIKEQVEWIAPVVVYPGEDELQALAEGAWRVISGMEEAKDYQ